MSERLAVDSLMTADGEVVQLPTLGPLGPVDAEGGRIPLDTVRLFDAEGRFLKVESYEFSTWSQRWVVHLGSGRDAYADDCYLSRPDSFERLLKDDSLEKLADDLDRVANCQCGTACTYLDRDRRDCEGCEFEHRDYSCVEAFLRDVSARIRRLSGGSK